MKRRIRILCRCELNVVFEGGFDSYLEADELVALLLEALDDLTHDATLDTIGLDGDEGPLEPGAGKTSVGHLVVSLDRGEACE